MSADFLSIFRSGRLVGDALKRYRTLACVGAVSITVVDLLDVVLPLVLKSIIDSIQLSDNNSLTWFCLLYVAIASVQALGRILWRVGFFQLGTRTARDIRCRLMGHLLRLPLSAFRKQRAGQIVSSAQSDVEAVRTLFEFGMVTLFDGIVLLMTIPLVMIFLSPGLALMSLLLLPVIPMLVLRSEKSLKNAARAQQDSVADLANTTHEVFSSIRVIKSFAKESHFAARFAERSAKILETSIELARREAFFSPKLEAVISLSMTILLLIGGDLVLTQQVSIGTYVAFQRYLQHLLWPTQAVAIWFAQAQRAAASSERIEQVFAEKEGFISSGIEKFETDRELALEVRDLFYTWPGEREAILRGVNFSLTRGERIAIVGPTGSGKTTLVQILVRALEADKGSVMLFGVDYATTNLEGVRAHLALVEQSPFLFSDTIHSNIAPSGDHTRVLEAARLASIDREILALPHGFESLVGERGVTLSGGQRQRIAIARSLVRTPEILIWDNALSSVDLVTEEKILSSLNNLPETSSLIVVTHRLSTTLHMDRILVIGEGKIMQQGTHEQLISDRQGWYYQFCEQQKRVSELNALEGEANHA